MGPIVCCAQARPIQGSASLLASVRVAEERQSDTRRTMDDGTRCWWIINENIKIHTQCKPGDVTRNGMRRKTCIGKGEKRTLFFLFRNGIYSFRRKHEKKKKRQDVLHTHDWRHGRSGHLVRLKVDRWWRWCMSHVRIRSDTIWKWKNIVRRCRRRLWQRKHLKERQYEAYLHILVCGKTRVNFSRFEFGMNLIDTSVTKISQTDKNQNSLWR